MKQPLRFLNYRTALLILLMFYFTEAVQAQSKFKLKMPGAIERTMADRLNDEFSIMDFGAVGDGKVDDTQAFILAIKAAQGKIIQLHGRTYAINLTITQGLIKLVGGGATLIPVNSLKPVITFSPEKYIYDVRLSDLQITGRQKKADGIFITNQNINNGCDFISLDRVIIRNCRYAFNVEGRSIWNKIHNSQMDGNIGGLRIKTNMPCNLWDISASTFNYNDRFGVWLQNENAHLEGFKNFKFQSSNFEGNGINDPESVGGYFDGVEMLVLDNMYVEGNGREKGGFGIKITGKLGRAFSINGGWFADSKYPIYIDGEKKWGNLTNLMANSTQKDSGDIFLKSLWANNEPKIELSNILGKVIAEVDYNGNVPVYGVDWYPYEGSEIDMRYRDWLKIYAEKKTVAIRKIEGLINGKRFGLINYTQANFNVVIDGSLMSNGQPVTILPNETKEFLVDGYPHEGKLRPLK